MDGSDIEDIQYEVLDYPVRSDGSGAFMSKDAWAPMGSMEKGEDLLESMVFFENDVDGFGTKKEDEPVLQLDAIRSHGLSLSPASCLIEVDEQKFDVTDDVTTPVSPTRSAEPTVQEPVVRTAAEIKATRLEAVMRHREKKKRRTFTKKILYHKRKVVADSRPRVMGRFVKKGH